MSIIEKLTEGIINRDLSRETNALLDKWEKTGLLEGLEGEHNRNSMAALLENQAKELLREASTMAGGDVEGFAAVAFPIVRRVFGGLVANELVSVQPMSLPSGLIFFLDFTTTNAKLGYEACDSIYGGNKVGAQITGGVDLSSIDGSEDGFYNLNNGYGSPTASIGVVLTTLASGTFGGGVANTTNNIISAGGMTAQQFDAILRYDPDFTSGTTTAVVAVLATASVGLAQFNEKDLVAITVPLGSSPGNSGQVRRLSQYSGSNFGKHQGGDPYTDVLVVYASLNGTVTTNMLAASATLAGNTTAAFPIIDDFIGGSSLGSIVGDPTWGLEGLGVNDGGDTCSGSNQTQPIAEIDIKVDSTAITATTKKLRAKWTPELQQDINAYHNLDAEVELTSILSEAIALEIDQEILEDLIKGATASTYYWSRKPGKFVNRATGLSTNEVLFPDFTGTVSEWYETLLETVNDVSAQIHRKTLRGGANFIVTSPEVANILEFTNGFRASTTADENRGTAGAVKTGTISKKWDVYVDPYFPRNLLLVGRKGGSFLESGYVYAPYVPLQTTPTIFDPENFTPRKGVMTRYGKKMVRPDMYGLVIVEDLLG